MGLEIATVSVRLPERLTPRSVSRFADDLHEALASPAHVVVIDGAGGDTYCLGLALEPHDVSDVHSFAALLLALHQAPKPVLTLVDGRALGGGLGIAASCDWVIATGRSTFALPELLWGLVPAMIWAPVTDRMAPHVARQWTMSAHARGADAAAAAGLVDDIVDPALLPRAAGRAARMLARLDTHALVRFRGWARASRASSMADALAGGAAMTAELLRTPAAHARCARLAAGEVPWA
jgi:enoyl-CoA hydratase/carnithine racemase